MIFMKRGKGKLNYVVLTIFIVIAIFLAITVIIISNTNFTGNVINFFGGTQINYSDQDVSFFQMQQVSNDLKNSYVNKRYWVKEGSFYYFDIKDAANLINTIGNSMGLNPASPYGMVLAPMHPQDKYSRENLLVPGSNLSMRFRMRSDEAIVIIGISPPKSRFFSYIPYLASRDFNNQEPLAKIGNKIFNAISAKMLEGVNTTVDTSRYNYQGSFDYVPPLNDEVINTSKKLSGNADGAFVIIVTADQNLDISLINELKKNIFPKYGINPDVVNTIHVPADVLNMGFKNESDDFQIINRFAYVENKTLGDLYISNPPIKVLRIVPNIPENNFSKKFSFVNMPPKDTGISEEEYNESLFALADAVKLAEFKSSRYLNSSARSTTLAGYLWLFEKCTKIGAGCGGDDQDAAYFSSLVMFNLTNTSDDFVVIVGMNHNATGKASYNNFVFYDLKYGMGIGSISQDNFFGSARKYLPYIDGLNVSASVKDKLKQNIDKFTAYKFSRVCGNESYCYTIPYNNYICVNSTTGKVYACGTPADAGVDSGVEIAVPERVYDDPLTNFGPSYNELIPPFYLYYKKK